MRKGEVNQEEGRVQTEKRGKELLTYSKNKERRRFGAEDIEVLPFPSLQLTSSSDDDPGISSSLVPDSSNDLDLPIAHQKGTRTCTKHPLFNFVSYSHLSPSYKAFVSLFLFLTMFMKHYLILNGSML